MKKLIESTLRSNYYYDIRFHDELAFKRVYNVVSGVLKKFAKENNVKINEVKEVGITTINVGGSETDWVSKSALGKSVTTPMLEMELWVIVKKRSFFSKSADMDVYDVKVKKEDFEDSGVVVREIENLSEFTFLFM